MCNCCRLWATPNIKCSSDIRSYKSSYSFCSNMHVELSIYGGSEAQFRDWLREQTIGKGYSNRTMLLCCDCAAYLTDKKRKPKDTSSARKKGKLNKTLTFEAKTTVVSTEQNSA